MYHQRDKKVKFNTLSNSVAFYILLCLLSSLYNVSYPLEPLRFVGGSAIFTGQTL